MASASDLRSAITALRNAPAHEKAGARAYALALGREVLNTVPDAEGKALFCRGLDADLDAAMKA